MGESGDRARKMKAKIKVMSGEASAQLETKLLDMSRDASFINGDAFVPKAIKDSSASPSSHL